MSIEQTPSFYVTYDYFIIKARDFLYTKRRPKISASVFALCAERAKRAKYAILKAVLNDTHGINGKQSRVYAIRKIIWKVKFLLAPWRKN